MSNVRALRLRAAAIDADYAQREARAEAKLEEIRCACDRPHTWAVAELIVRKGGTVVKRLVAAPGGFESVPL